jgi:hypothetical protein
MPEAGRILLVGRVSPREHERFKGSERMNIEAKPPVRRGPDAGAILLFVLGAPLCIGLLIVGALTVSYFFARSAPHPAHVVHTPAYYDTTMVVSSTVSPEFEARLNAANRIQVTSERDEALAILAADFAQTVDEANRAIQGIQDSDTRDTAAWNTARRFSELNRPQDSVTMIETMLDQKTRDAGFRAVATGSWPERPGDRMEGTTTAADSYTTQAPVAEAGVAH